VGNAEFLLAKCAEEGLGRMYDREKAIELYVRAAEHGSFEAFKKLKTLPSFEVEKARGRLRMKPAERRVRIGESDYDEDD
jgi:TPR repeat protein